MIPPLKSVTVVPGGAFGVLAVAGTGLPDANGIKRHIGVDLRAAVGTQFFAPGAGRVNELYTGSSGIIVLGAEIEGMWHRFLHIKDSVVQVGQSFPEGALLGHTGNTGNVLAHLHWDVRKPNTLWSANFSNYVDPMKLTNQEGDVIVGKVKIVGTPASVSWGNGRIDVFALGDDKPISGLWHKWFKDGWHPWERVGDAASPPSVSSWAEGRLDIFFTGVSGDLVHLWYANGKFQGPEALGFPKE